MTTVVVTGAHGQIGREVVAQAHAAGHTVVGLTRTGRVPCDVTNHQEVLAALRSTAPDLVVHCAGWTDVDACEADPTTADVINHQGTRHVADACDSVGAHLVHLSTDYVFDGTKAGPYVESDAPHPLSVYGRSKLAAEQALPAGATVVRTSWVSGHQGPNMVHTILRLAAQGGVIRMVDDQVGQPTIAADLAGALVQLGLARHAGVFHVTNQGPVSWAGFTAAVLELAGFDPTRVVPISTAELRPRRAAARPANSVLASTALQAAGLPLLRHHLPALAELVADLQADPKAAAEPPPT